MKLTIKAFLLLTIIFCSIYVEAENTISPEKTNVSNKKWFPLFKNAKDTIHWQSTGKGVFPNEGWQINHDHLILKSGRKGGDIMTKNKYSNFELKLEFKMTRLVNSGIKYFVTQMENKQNGRIEWIGYEYQIIDDFHRDEIRGFNDDKGSTAALYLLYAPSNKKNLMPLGEWNSLKIKVKNNKIEHWLNGKRVLSVNKNAREFEELVKETKFVNYKDYSKKDTGYILIQDHDSEIQYRNILVREL